MFFDLCWIWSKKTSVSSFYKENNFKPCLTKQLLNMFKLWCERGISLISLIRPLMEYGDVVGNNCYDCDSALLDSVQYEAARLVTGAIEGTSSARLYKELAWKSLSIRRKLHILSQFYKIVKNLAPHYLSELLPKLSSERTHYHLRQKLITYSRW